MNNTCFGCKHFRSEWFGDGTTLYKCALVPGFEQLKANNWVHIFGSLWRCNVHGTMFNVDDEPCWVCYSICEEEV